MYAQSLKNEFTRRANDWAAKYSFSINSSISPKPVSAVMFDQLKGNLHSDSLKAIGNIPLWKGRLVKPHQKHGGLGYKEMQSSNSSDALAMSIFCHPDLPGWKGVAKLFRMDKIEQTQIIFGHKPGVQKSEGEDSTEIDIFLNDKVFCEAKLTEENFTEKAKEEVLKYRDFTKVFAIGYLPQNNTEYSNYQLIRNILAAHQHNKDFRLIVDARRPDLVKSFINTVACIVDVQLRTRCKIVFWQDIAAASGKDLQDFLIAKYGI